MIYLTRNIIIIVSGSGSAVVGILRGQWAGAYRWITTCDLLSLHLSEVKIVVNRMPFEDLLDVCGRLLMEAIKKLLLWKLLEQIR